MGPAAVGRMSVSHIEQRTTSRPTYTDGGRHHLNNDETKLNRDKTDHLYIETFNVENVKGNYIYARQSGKLRSVLSHRSIQCSSTCLCRWCNHDIREKHRPTSDAWHSRPWCLMWTIPIQLNENKDNRRPSETWASGDWWRMAGKQIDVSSQENHLGLIREPIDTASATVAANIKKARRCAYSLMGAGIYGMNGIHPEVSIHLWNVYAIPWLTYGLEIYQLNQTNINK